MAQHFVYRHLSASGLGRRDPRRPYVTGGLGSGVPIYITLILDQRDPLFGSGRDPFTDQSRDPIFGATHDPIYGAGREIVSLLQRDPIPVVRTPGDESRDPTHGLKREFDDEEDSENYAEFSGDIEDPNGT